MYCLKPVYSPAGPLIYIFVVSLGRTSLYILSFMETIFCHNCVPDGRKLTVRQLYAVRSAWKQKLLQLLDIWINIMD